MSTSVKRTECPNCARPMGYEYVVVEADKCQLWRVMNEDGSAVDPRTVADCFARTSRRLRELSIALADARAIARAAQAALSRHHAAEHVKVEPFRDGARITS